MTGIPAAWHSARARGLHWPLAIVSLLGLNMVIVFITVAYATGDKSAAVEPDYYRKAVEWDQVAAEHEASRKLGWQAGTWIDFSGPTSHLLVTLTDREGRPVRGAQVEAETFASLRSADRQTLHLLPSDAAPDTASAYSAPISIHQPGLWEVRLTCRRGDETFMADLTTSVDMSPAPAPSDAKKR